MHSQIRLMRALPVGQKCWLPFFLLGQHTGQEIGSLLCSRVQRTVILVERHGGRQEMQHEPWPSALSPLYSVRGSSP